MNKQKCVKVTILFLGCIVLISSGCSMNVSDRIPEIVFPQYKGDVNPDLEVVNNIDKASIKGEELLAAYYTTNGQAMEVKEPQLKSIFGFTGNDTKRNKDCKTFINGKEELEVYSSGAFHYENKDIEEKEVLLSDDKCSDISKAFLEENGLLPDDFSYTGMGYAVRAQETINGPQNETIIAKHAYFNRTINNASVECTSRIIVSITGNGEIAEIYSAFREISESHDVQNVIPISEAIENAKNFDGLIDIVEDADKVVYTDIEVIYWEDSAPYSENATIQPIYRINGICYKDNVEVGVYVALVSAIKE